MKAIVCRKYGSPEVLELKEVPKPTPKDNEVLIKIYATSVTASDVLMRGLNAPFIYRFLIQLMMGFGKPKNPIMGMVLSGVVERVGKNVNSFKKGDAVFASGSMSAFKLRFGAYAEYMCLPEDWNLSLKPANLNFEEAAAIPYGAGLAWFYFKNMKIQPNHKVLIYGASGSVGLLATQLAKNSGAIVTAVCSAKNFNLVKSLGADKVIDYTLSNAVAQLEEYNFVFDAVGKTKTSVLKIRSKKALSPNGKYVSVDDSAPSTSKADFIKIKDLVEQGKLKPTIDSVYPLEQMVEAHKYVEQGHKKGSVVISIAKN
ncbi:NAD(P)-dependent alcohol dehydrogenase [Portibacter lacus]|uniref:Alcohol dehydrogenase n=1 Tax=Portibacter lacus TaxID=1099794 RepID=A0AA37WHL8_9BACT|nr:NAD(P)-dependent alcohol dehydrogenase [Portibacter lacus]GLR19589.1 alcohol dehydrogenase [Portibacter lacus]